ncbi:hypothetical protein T492DRAFT_842740 [Pavlovales sp. CCMP2436]|nr:hypothetical protein T492DRAFT_842740 [Pavlovales sp. CCMP2436]|eukprot:CAMPEP_0179886436 /NCGR_PEP_ID=MMETSP0982-20121206/30845_1 /TAXON_ID=483367 /ORGANISM="non described non described, Strain CCMP 2436" /LENGTH=199 /DNA_ID=CAMNT_0021782147 /DNA_START=9 /DNA_END=608 /DNA_ORIENTATION=-
MTTCKDALKKLQETLEEGQKVEELEDVRLCMVPWQMPLITKMDASLNTLKKCKHLRLSSNQIDRIGSLAGLESLEILSMSRNLLKKLENLDAVAGTLKQLWISYNNLIALNGIEKLQHLEVLYMSNNKVHDIKEIERLQTLPKLHELLFKGNAFHQRFLAEGNDEKAYRLEILMRLPNLKVLDGLHVDDDERAEAQARS